MEKLTSLYNAVKSTAWERDDCYNRILAAETMKRETFGWTDAEISASRKDAARMFNFQNGVVSSLIQDYVAGGGKRDLTGFMAEDKEV